MIEIKEGLRLKLGKENFTVVDGKLKLDNPQQSVLVHALRATGQESLYADDIRIKYDQNCVPLAMIDQDLLLGQLTEEEAEILGVTEAWTALQAELSELADALAESDAKHAADDDAKLTDDDTATEPIDADATEPEAVVEDEPIVEAEPVAEAAPEPIVEAKPATTRKQKNAKIDDIPQE
jgi:hypothetical protein